ncbi:MAG: histidine phosphatase family protein [Deltaproteobacteria bacterium]|nr:histidine phosphatase family protein [Deltaproteobacteria bacterium]
MNLREKGDGRGREVLEAIAVADPAARVAVMLRHAARDEFVGLENALSAALIAEGRAAARAFGVGLPVSRPLRLWHSPVSRCEETAALIGEGFAGAGGEVSQRGEAKFLFGPYVKDGAAMVELSRATTGDFLRHWFDGGVPASILDPRDDAAAGQVARIRARMLETPAGALTIFVTHDWNILAVRESVLGVRHEDAGWIDFLDGVVFTENGSTLSARWRGHAASL